MSILEDMKIESSQKFSLSEPTNEKLKIQIFSKVLNIFQQVRYQSIDKSKFYNFHEYLIIVYCLVEKLLLIREI